MFARLFDNISIRSLFNSLVLAGLLAGLAFLQPAPAESFSPLKGLFKVPGSWLPLLGWVMALLSGAVFTEFLNRRRIFPGNHHFTVIFVALSCAFLQLPQASDGWWYLPIHMYFVYKILDLQGARDGRYILFDLGAAAGILVFFHWHFLFYLPLGWILALLQGLLSPKSTIASLLGFTGMAFTGGVLGDAWGFSAWSLLVEQWQTMQWEWGLQFSWSSIYLIPMGLLLGLALFQYPGRMSRANAMQRQTFQLWYLLFLYGLAGWLFLGDKILWTGLSIIPFSWILASFQGYQKNGWIRDTVYLLILSLPVLVLLTRLGLLRLPF